MTANTGAKIEPLINGVKTGQELWFPNTGYRTSNGYAGTGVNAGGQMGDFWTSTPTGGNAYAMIFRISDYPTGNPNNTASKLSACSIRCVR